MLSVFDRVTASTVGQFAFKTVRPFAHRIRQIWFPSIPVENTFTKVFYRGREFRLEHRRWGSDRQVIDQCFKDLQYDLPVGAHGVLIQNLYDEIVASGRKPLIIDCGANIGASVAWFRARYPEAHLVAIEPAPDNFALLLRNSIHLDTESHQAGIAGTDGTAYLTSHDGCHMGYRTNTSCVGQKIAAISVKTLLASKSEDQYTPFLLKIDIEGAEKSLFDGDTAAINRFPLILIEPHDWLFPGQLSSQSFFRFHVAAGREFCMRNENIASIACHSSLLQMTTGLKY